MLLLYCHCYLRYTSIGIEATSSVTGLTDRIQYLELETINQLASIRSDRSIFDTSYVFKIVTIYNLSNACLAVMNFYPEVKFQSQLVPQGLWSIFEKED